MTNIVKLEHVCREYGQGDAVVHAVQDVSLEIEPGSFVALAGPSGSGKSTLLNVISGLDRPSSGRVYIGDEETTSRSGSWLSRLRMERIGFVFQAFNLFPVLTAFENAEYVLMLQGVPVTERRRRVLAMLDRVGLTGLADRYPRELSGGQQQRVAVARAIVPEPALILADEPTANLDSQTGAALLDLMAELNREKGTTFLFSSHDPKVLDRARRVVRLSDGRIVADETMSRSARAQA